MLYATMNRSMYRRWFGRTPAARAGRAGWWRHVRPPQLFVGSFLLLILLGTLGLRTLPGLYTGEPLGWLDSLFTATSAVCVTGLIVVDTATHFTTLGQAFLLLLIQLGGLGIVTFTTVIILALGRRISLRAETVSAAAADIAPDIDYRTLARDIVIFTLAIEAAGAIVLLIAWAPRMGLTTAAWPALFHSISAFCNAGFSVFSDSLMSMQQAPATLLAIMTLIVSGGIGFLTIEEVRTRRRLRRMKLRRDTDRLVPRLSTHSRLVLSATALLLLVGWAFFTVYEWNLSFAGMPAWARVLNGLFMSVTARTAGFNTIDYATASDGSNFFTILLMFIGGSPGSMAGGVKTTTFAVVGLLAWARFRGDASTSFMKRTVPEETIQRAVGLIVVAFALVTAAIVVFTTIEIGVVSHGATEAGFLRYMFEAVSAFNTVGLSMGVTAELTPMGRMLTILLMYLGRVGPLTFAAAIALRPRSRSTFRYAHEDVIIG
jgi:trk system potassium uptake protein